MKLRAPRSSSVDEWYEVLDAIRDGKENKKGEIVEKTSLDSYVAYHVVTSLIYHHLVDEEIKPGTYIHRRGEKQHELSRVLSHIKINERGMEFVEKWEASLSAVKALSAVKVYESS